MNITITDGSVSDAEPMPGRARQLGHVVLYVADLDRSLAFYRDILGWPTITPAGTPGYAAFQAGDTHHDLLLLEVGRDAQPLPAGRRLGMYHFGSRSETATTTCAALLSRMRTRPDLVQVQGMVDEGFAHSIYVTDPDGNEVELYVDLPGADWSAQALFASTMTRRRLVL